LRIKGPQTALPPAIVFIESPWSVFGLRRETFTQDSCQKIILVDEGQSVEKFFSDGDRIIPCRLMDKVQLDQVCRQLAKMYRVTAVLGFSETSVVPAAYVAAAFGVSGIGLEAAQACRNKALMAEHLIRGGVNTPANFLVDRDEELLADKLGSRVSTIGGFPVICKPLMGFASNGVIRADDVHDLMKAIRRARRINRLIMSRYYEEAFLHQLLVQAFVPGTEIAVDGYVSEGETHIVAVIDKPGVSQGPYFNDALHVLPARLDDKLLRKVRRVTERSVASLGLDATPFHLEARISTGEIHVIEVAARVGFVHSIRDALGVDICEATWHIKTGRTPETKPLRQRYAGNYCITAKNVGRFVCIDNVEEVLSDPCVIAVPLFVQPGDRVAPPPEGNNYIGYILVVADTYEEAHEALGRAARKLQVVLA
jgi:biotin carboxylase